MKGPKPTLLYSTPIYPQQNPFNARSIFQSTHTKKTRPFLYYNKTQRSAYTISQPTENNKMNGSRRSNDRIRTT
jgi:hypothetical protein